MRNWLKCLGILVSMGTSPVFAQEVCESLAGTEAHERELLARINQEIHAAVTEMARDEAVADRMYDIWGNSPSVEGIFALVGAYAEIKGIELFKSREEMLAAAIYSQAIARDIAENGVNACFPPQPPPPPPADGAEPTPRGSSETIEQFLERFVRDNPQTGNVFGPPPEPGPEPVPVPVPIPDETPLPPPPDREPSPDQMPEQEPLDMPDLGDDNFDDDILAPPPADGGGGSTCPPGDDCGVQAPV